MIFNSLVFVLFIACFFALWSFVKNHTTIRCCYILAASLFFYGWWNWYYLFVLILSGIIDFAAALLIEKSSSERRKKLWLTVSMLTNLGMLGTFKYSEFIVENINNFLHFLGYAGSDLVVNLPDFFLILPIGISFYTFQSMSYTIDVYKGDLKPTKNILHFFTYLTLFPQLVAGPIERASNLLPQITQTPKSLTEEERFQALCLIIWGYFKKMVIADNLAYVVDDSFSNSIAASCALWWWVVVLGFAFQIYCDFSGYTDIARGLARWMGLHLMKNFNTPYFSTDIREFWSRWHISLSSWFLDYVYIPLGGSRNGTWRTYRNLWITLGLSGLWHGAAWTFVCWGLCHALFSSIERLFGICTALKKKGHFGMMIAWILTSMQIFVTLVVFRSESLSRALDVLKVMFSPNLTGGVPFGEFFRWSFIGGGMSTKRVYFVLFVCGCLFLAEAFWLFCRKRNLDLVEKLKIPPLAQAVFMGIFLFLCVFLRGPEKQFVYFQF